MSGRKCECCYKVRLGYCPYDYVCRYEVWERFGKVKKQVLLSSCFGCVPERSVN